LYFLLIRVDPTEKLLWVISFAFFFWSFDHIDRFVMREVVTPCGDDDMMRRSLLRESIIIGRVSRNLCRDTAVSITRIMVSYIVVHLAWCRQILPSVFSCMVWKPNLKKISFFYARTLVSSLYGVFAFWKWRFLFSPGRSMHILFTWMWVYLFLELNFVKKLCSTLYSSSVLHFGVYWVYFWGTRKPV
jgi:hypothetical protein